LNVSNRISSNAQSPSFIKVRPVVADFFPCGRAVGRTDG